MRARVCVYVCMVCMALVAAKVLGTKYQDLYVRVRARDTYHFSCIRLLLTSQDDKIGPMASDAREQGLHHYSICVTRI